MTPGEGWLSRFPEDLLTHLLDSPALGGDIRLAALRPDGQAWSTTGFSRLVLAALAPWLTDALLNRYSQYLATNVTPFDNFVSHFADKFKMSITNTSDPS